MTENRIIDVFWTVHNDFKWSISETEAEARESLTLMAEEIEEPSGWTIEHTREEVPLLTGELVEGFGEAITLDELGAEETVQSYSAIHVFWQCPHCGERHNNSILKNPMESKATVSNPSLWFCESGTGIVLVGW